MADAYLKVKDNNGTLSLIREESDVSVVDLKNAFKRLAINTDTTWQQGGINNNTGGNVNNINNMIRTAYMACTYATEITIPSGYVGRVAIYTSEGGTSGFLGWLDGEDWSGTKTYVGMSGAIFRMRLSKSTSGDVTPADGENITIARYTTDRTLSLENVPADAKSVGDALSIIQDIQDEISDIKGSSVLTSGDYTLSKGRIISSTGVNDAPNSSNYSLITLDVADIKTISLITASQGLGGDNGYGCAFYDSNNAYISGVDFQTPNQDIEVNIDVPSSAKYWKYGFYAPLWENSRYNTFTLIYKSDSSIYDVQTEIDDIS